MYTSILILIFIIPDSIFMEPESYNRSVLMEKYPDLENNFVIFPGGNNGRAKIGYLDRPSRPARLFFSDNKIDDDITFTLYTREKPDGKQLKKFTDLPKDINTTNNNVFITHGWMSDGKSDSCSVIKKGYLKESDANVFIMDWGPIAGNIFYFFPMEQTKDVGKYYSRFLNFLVDDRGMDPKNFHLIGHSLGAHVSGFASRGLTKGKVGRITGLDPALPGFDELGSMKEGRLNKKDADLVDVIHTCAGFLGFKHPMGHVDFYPNGGEAPQPGCSVLEIVDACSHGRSFQLYAESITLKESFTASKCDSLEILFTGKCSGAEIPMGYMTPNDAEGLYYIETTGMQPYMKL